MFLRSERLSAFLRYVVEETLRGDGGGLKEAVIGREVYGRGTDFDTAADPIVRVDARRLRDKLREYYAESPGDPILITLQKGNYVPVFEWSPALPPPVVRPFPKPDEMPPADPVRPAARSRPRWWFAAALVCLAVAGGAVWYLLPRESQPPARLIPLTTSPGNESQPALSPDGNFVAFAWNGGTEGNGADIYIKDVRSEAQRPLTDTMETESSPAWSPDGREIAFVREAKGVFLISAIGGPERRVLESGTHVGWADSKSILVRDRCDNDIGACLYQIVLETGDKRRLTRPPVGFNDGRFDVSPDGQTLAFIRGSVAGASDLYTMPIAGGEPRCLTHWNSALEGVSWTPDGRDLVYSVLESSGSRLWRLPAAGASTGNGVRIADAGEDAMSPSLPRRTSARLAYAKVIEDVSVRVVDLSAPRSGEIITAATPLADATFSRDCGVRMSPDGSEVAFTSLRSGEHLLWVSRRDGSGLRWLHPKWQRAGGRVTADVSSLTRRSTGTGTCTSPRPPAAGASA